VPANWFILKKLGLVLDGFLKRRLAPDLPKQPDLMQKWLQREERAWLQEVA